MIIHAQEPTMRRVGYSIIQHYLTQKDSQQVGIALATLYGDAPVTQNHRSERLYFILEGQGVVLLGACTEEVQAGDLVYVPKHMLYSASGELRTLVITVPASSTTDEERYFDRHYSKPDGRDL